MISDVQGVIRLTIFSAHFASGARFFCLLRPIM